MAEVVAAVGNLHSFLLDVAAVVDDCYIVALAAVLAQLKGADDVAAGGVEDSVGVENRECMEAFESPQHLESNWKGRTIA